MSVAGTGLRVAPDQPGRRLARFALGREVARVRRSGTPVLTFQPTGADLGLMGLNAMDESRRTPVSRSAYESTCRRLDSSIARDRVAILRSEPSPPA
jgi:hypothetical protein